jgi:zinc finger CCCH domain-containing protein 13
MGESQSIEGRRKWEQEREEDWLSPLSQFLPLSLCEMQRRSRKWAERSEERTWRCVCVEKEGGYQALLHVRGKRRVNYWRTGENMGESESSRSGGWADEHGREREYGGRRGWKREREEVWEEGSGRKRGRGEIAVKENVEVSVKRERVKEKKSGRERNREGGTDSGRDGRTEGGRERERDEEKARENER